MKNWLAVTIAIAVTIILFVVLVARPGEPEPVVQAPASEPAARSAPAADRPMAPAVATAAAQAITVVGWNVESGGALQPAVAERIAAFQDVDIWGLSEVLEVDAEAYEFAAEEGEGADFESLLGTTGGADRLLLIWDAERYERTDGGELHDIRLGGRSPLYVQLRNQKTLDEMIVMVNHLHRSNEDTRHAQGRLLNEWAARQDLPIIALGDYNFDWDLEDGDEDHDVGYDLLTANQVWEWIRPDELVTTQCSGWPCRYKSVLDFVFVAGPAKEWGAQAEIVVVDGDFPDDNTTPDHRPVRAVLWPGAGTGDVTPPVSPAATPDASGAGTARVRLGEIVYDGDVPQVESDEYVEIVNEGPAVDLAGWRLQDDDGSVFTFPAHTMQPGERCRVYTDEIHVEHCGFSFGSRQPIWTNAGDVAILLDPAGVEVDRQCWGRGCD